QELVSGFEGTGSARAFGEFVSQFYRDAPPDVRNRLLSGEPAVGTILTSLNVRSIMDIAPLASCAGLHGLGDGMSLCVPDAAAIGCIVGVPIPNGVRAGRGRLQSWARTTAHIASALRLREAMLRCTTGSAHRPASVNAVTESPDAILDASGRIHDA